MSALAINALFRFFKEKAELLVPDFEKTLEAAVSARWSAQSSAPDALRGLILQCANERDDPTDIAQVILDNVGVLSHNWLAGHALEILVADYGVSPLLRSQTGERPSMVDVAALWGPDSFIEAMLEKLPQTELNYQGENGMTVLHYLSSRCLSEHWYQPMMSGIPRLADKMLAKGVDPEIEACSTGCTAFEELVATFADPELKSSRRPEVEQLAAILSDQESSGVLAAELLKDEGNNAFKAGSFEDAVRIYARGVVAIDRTCNYSQSHDQQTVKLKATLLSNAAQCYLNMGNEIAALYSAWASLDLDPTNLKALNRRALAHERADNERAAKQDCEALLKRDPGNASARQMMQRLQASAKLKKAESDARIAATRIDVFYGRTDNTPGCKKYGCIIVSTPDEQIQYYDDVHEPRDCQYEILFEVDGEKVKELFGECPAAVGWVASPLKEKVLELWQRQPRASRGL